MNDRELNDTELGRELSALTPEPAADYWTRIDAMLAGVEAEQRGDPMSADGPSAIGASSLGEEAQPGDHADTDDNVVRLTDMNEERDLLNRFNLRGGLILAAAASIVVVFAVAGVLVLRDDSTNIDATTDDMTESTPLPDDGTDGSATAAPIAATHCFYEANTALVEGEQALRLVVRSDGSAVSAERFVGRNGQSFVTTATGFTVDDAARRFAMTSEFDGQVVTRIWRISDSGLSTDLESFIPTGDCADVDEALAEVEMPQPVVPDPDSIDRALDPGSYCWQGDGLIRGFYRLTIGDDGAATVVAHSNNSANDPVIYTIETGTGTFATANEIALNVERWTPEGFTADSVIYTINGADLQPTIVPNALATPADCDVLDEWRLPEEGLNIYTDEELAFPPGVTRATVQGGLVRGELGVFRVEAERGQTMTVTISSPEDNAAVAVYTPDRLAIVDNEDGSGSRSVVLPDSGVYQIVVSSIRGNVSYTLDVEFR